MPNVDTHPSMRVINIAENPAFQQSSISSGEVTCPNSRPATVRPGKASTTVTASLASVYSDPRESMNLNSSGNNDPQTSSEEDEEDEIDEESVRNLSRASAATTASSTTTASAATAASTIGSEVSGEQPLDLSTSRKRKISENVERSPTPSVTTTSVAVSPSENKKPKIKVKEEEQLISSPARPSPRMAYPRPLHPLFLDSLLYRRPPAPSPQPPQSGFGNRFGNGFQRFPFLGPRFDMLRPQMPANFGVKPFQVRTIIRPYIC